MKIAFFEAKEWEANYLKEKLPNHQLVFFDHILSPTTLPNERDFEIISGFTGSKIDATILANFSNLKMIASRTTGIDHIDEAATKAKGVVVKNVPTYGENTVAEFAFALLLDLSRKITQASFRVRDRANFTTEGLEGFDLSGKTIGVLGTGHIGKHSIKIANGFDMKVIAFDAMPNRVLEQQLNFKYVSLEDLLKSSDVITIHVPYLPTTHHLINKNNVSLIKKGCVLINTARGAIVETEALVLGLNQGILGGVGLDVLEEEAMLKNERQMVMESELKDEDLRTVLENHVLMGMDKVIITPHNAFNTREAMVRILATTIENINSFTAPTPTVSPAPAQPT
ncbi:MAG TPA: NAD(P)-dependent oxidoreductase [Candidatus Saccharimonadales bacterium]|nr:NAD(P)-dependent oxidoreductase [Candidatus Saccharimonadales bacterium]